MQKAEDCYSEQIQTQMEKQERESVKYTSFYEFRVIQCYQFNIKQELSALFQYIRNNKECQTKGDYKMRFDDEIIVQQLQQDEIMASSAIMADSNEINEIQEVSRLNNLKYLTWDAKFSKNFCGKKKQQIIQQLNSVDLVIMDSKEHVKITKFLNNLAQIEQIEEEDQAKLKLYDILVNKKYKTQDIIADLDQVVESLQYVLNRKMSLKYVDFSSSPRRVNIQGISFQRFILLPGIKKNIAPIYSKCSWIISTFCNQEQSEYIQQGFIGKLLRQQKQVISQEIMDRITINLCQFQYLRVYGKTNISMNSQLNLKKYTLRQLQFRPDLFQKIINYSEFLSLSFNLLYFNAQEPQQELLYLQRREQEIEVSSLEAENSFQDSTINPFANVNMNLESSFLNLKCIAAQLNIPLSNNIIDIIKTKSKDQCPQCFRDDHSTRFVFGCCGISICIDCLLNSIKFAFNNQSYQNRNLKCPLCKLKILDISEKLCFFITLDPQTKHLNDQYLSFYQYQQTVKIPNSDSTIIEINKDYLKPISVTRVDKNQHKKDQLILCIDQLVPEHLDNNALRDFVTFHIRNLIYNELIQTNYTDLNVYIYTQRESIHNIINQSTDMF